MILGQIVILFLLNSRTLAFLEETMLDYNLQLTSSVEGDLNFTVPLTFTCTFKYSDHPAVVQLMTLTLSKRLVGQTEFTKLVSLSANAMKESDGFVGMATGHVTNDGSSDSVLTVEFAQPSVAELGQYKCQSVGMDESNHIVGSESFVSIRSVSKDVKDVFDCMKGAPRPSMAIVKQSLLHCGATEDSWFQTLREITEIERKGKVLGQKGNDDIIGVSEVSDQNSFYVFTRDEIPFEEAVEVCQENSGYLAEVNTEEEFSFINSTFNNLRRFTFVNGRSIKGFGFVTGARFTSLDGPFKFYTHPEADVYLGHWSMDEPHRSSLAFNWLELYDFRSNGALLMADTSLSKYPSKGFLCEVSQEIE